MSVVRDSDILAKMSVPHQPHAPIVNKVTYYSIEITWSPPTRQGSEHLTPEELDSVTEKLMYCVQQADENSGRGFVTVYEGPDFTREFTGLEMATVYSYRVRCSNIVGPSEWSPVITAETTNKVISADYIHKIIASNNVKRFQEVIKDYPSFLDVKDVHGRSTLMAACGLGKEEMVECLLKSGADVEFQTKAGKTCLMEACNCGRNGCVLLLHKVGVALSTEDLSGLTALHWAVLGGHSDTVELLLSTIGIPVDIIGKTNTSKWSPLLYLASVGGSPAVAKVLLLHKANVNRKDSSGNTPLMIAAASCSKSNIELIEVLLNFGADPKIMSKFKHTALDYAKAAENKPAVVKILEESMKPS